MWRHIVAALKDEEGATLVEYGLMLFLIMAVCVGAVALIGTTVNGKYSEVVSRWP